MPLVVWLILMFVVVSCGDQTEARPPEGTRSFDISERPKHVEGTVRYAQAPPVGGDHSPVWQNCGFYEEPVANEQGVHSMEHGAVWITHRPDLSDGQVGQLRQLAQSQTYVLISPYPDLSAPVMASAWGKQLRLKAAGDPKLEKFMRAFREGPQTPEIGAPCTGGKGQPG